MSLVKDAMNVEIAPGQVWDSGSGVTGFFVILAVSSKVVGGKPLVTVKGEVINDYGRRSDVTVGKNVMLGLYPELYLDDVRTDSTWGAFYKGRMKFQSNIG